jgi:hypothetical protein
MRIKIGIHQKTRQVASSYKAIDLGTADVCARPTLDADEIVLGILIRLELVR